MTQSGSKRATRSEPHSPARTSTRRRLELYEFTRDGVEGGKGEEGRASADEASMRTTASLLVDPSSSRERDVHNGLNESPERRSAQQAHARSDDVAKEVVSPLMATDAVGRNVGTSNARLSPSPDSEHLEEHGFSHLRESVSFVLPQLHASAQCEHVSRGTLLQKATQFPPSVGHSSVSSSHSRMTKRPHFLSQPSSNNIRRHKRRGSGSDLSFLSTRSAIEYINGTSSAAEAPSTRGSLRSSQATVSRNSLSKSTLGPLDLSPILEESIRPRSLRDKGRLRSRHKPPPLWPPIEVPVASASSHYAARAAAEMGDLETEVGRRFQRLLVYYVRMIFLLTISSIALSFGVFLASPLFVRQSGHDRLFVRQYVESVAELHLIYSAQHSSLASADVKKLYLRMLSESLERIDHATRHMKPGPDEGVAAHDQYYRRMIGAYEMVRHRVTLYARSRHKSWLYRHVVYPLHDAWRYGVVRHGASQAQEGGVGEFLLVSLWVRLKEIAICLRQDENMPCPTLAFLEEGLRCASESRSFVSHCNDPVPPHCTTADNTLLSKNLFLYIAKRFRHKNREYNHLFYEGDADDIVP